MHMSHDMQFGMAIALLVNVYTVLWYCTVPYERVFLKSSSLIQLFKYCIFLKYCMHPSKPCQDQIEFVYSYRTVQSRTGGKPENPIMFVRHSLSYPKYILCVTLYNIFHLYGVLL